MVFRGEWMKGGGGGDGEMGSWEVGKKERTGREDARKGERRLLDLG